MRFWPEAVKTIFAPSACASMTAAEPTPPAAAWISAQPPEVSFPRWISVSCAVTKTSGIAAASAELGASEATVKMHRSQVMKKTLAKFLPGLVRMADKLKSITWPTWRESRSPSQVINSKGLIA
jgi:hypothetical protein